MNRRSGHWLLMVLAAWALAACSLTKPPPEPDPNIFPTAFRKEILDILSTTLGDPTNVRDASISDPVLGPVEKDQRYTVCLRFNERDAEHHYMGTRRASPISTAAISISWSRPRPTSAPPPPTSRFPNSKSSASATSAIRP